MDTEALVDLAVTLNKAREAANAIKAVALTSSAYGDIAEALKKVLVQLVGSYRAPKTYQALLDGCSIPDALTKTWRDEL